jgi:hypothetical protein
MMSEGLAVEVDGTGWCLVTGEPSPPGREFVQDASGVKTLLVTARPNALMEGKSGNKGLPETTMGGGLNADGVEVVTALVLGFSLRCLTMLLTSVAN